MQSPGLPKTPTPFDTTIFVLMRQVIWKFPAYSTSPVCQHDQHTVLDVEMPVEPWELASSATRKCKQRPANSTPAAPSQAQDKRMWGSKHPRSFFTGSLPFAEAQDKTPVVKQSVWRKCKSKANPTNFSTQLFDLNFVWSPVFQQLSCTHSYLIAT